MTALVRGVDWFASWDLGEGGVDVTRLKCAISPGRRHTYKNKTRNVMLESDQCRGKESQYRCWCVVRHDGTQAFVFSNIVWIPTKSPPAPMPLDDAAAATTAAISDMKATGILSLESIVCRETRQVTEACGRSRSLEPRCFWCGELGFSSLLASGIWWYRRCVIAASSEWRRLAAYKILRYKHDYCEILAVHFMARILNIYALSKSRYAPTPFSYCYAIDDDSFFTSKNRTLPVQ